MAALGFRRSREDTAVIPSLYDVIYADPPWKYNSRAHHKTRFRGGACGHYRLMRTDVICSLPVESLAAKNCMLFLWATFPMLADALRVVEAWGFRYCTAGFLWIKLNKNGTPFFGVGYYTKSNPEICLLARRGSAIKPATNCISNLANAERREHSRKPDEVRRRIEELYPDARRLELFARANHEGWDSWGDECECTADLAERLKGHLTI